MKRFWIKLTNYEYWPMWAFYLPLLPYFLYRGIVRGNVFHFTNVNHNLDAFRGLFFDSKKVIDDKIPQAYRPKSSIVDPGNYSQDDFKNWEAPLIIKPDKGERGRGVKFLWDKNNLTNTIKQYNENVLVQEYCDYPMEFGVFIALNPVNLKYEILSLTRKHYFEVEGDGKSSIRELVLESERGKVFFKELKEISRYDFNTVPLAGQRLVLHTQGNHCKGTRFENANHLINSAMTRIFSQFLKGLDGFEYGRFDVKCKSTEDLETFSNFKVIEFNGIAAEPTIVYDSSVGYLNSLKIFISHWKRLEKLSKFNKSRNYKPIHTGKLLRKILGHYLFN